MHNFNQILRARFIVAFAAVVLLAAWAPDYSKYSDDQKVARIAFKHACQETNYNCKGLEAPVVRRAGYLKTVYIRGIFKPGSYIVWLDTTLQGTQQWLTTYHEVIHYLQEANTAIQGFDGKHMKCVVEWEAWKYTNDYVDFLRAPQTFKRSLSDWQGLYNCAPTSEFKGFMH